MVNILFTILSLLSFAEESFYTNPKTIEVYEGEVFQLHYILESKFNFLEVEVEKFAEFKGFWKENTILRQGPVNLLGFDQTKKVIVAEYQLVPVLNSKEYLFSPMHLVIKPSGQKIQNTLSTFKIKKLPPPSNDLQKKFFTGAVGEFRWSLMTPQVFFQKNEGFLLRVLLQGRGNFPEITSIPLQLPKGLKLVQQRTYDDIVNFSGGKIFEFLIEYQDFGQNSLELSPFVFFNPYTKGYVTLNPLTIDFKPLPPKLNETIPELKKEIPTNYLLILGWLALVAAVGWISYKAFLYYKVYEQSPRYQRKKRLQELLKGSAKDSFSEVCALARQNILAKTHLEPGMSNSELLKAAKPRLSSTEHAYYQTLFQAQEEAFLPQNPREIDSSLLLKLKSYI